MNIDPNDYGMTEETARDILQRERMRVRQHEEWCNENEGRFTEADNGIQTMANYDKFWDRGC